MKQILSILLALVAFSVSAQVRISDSTDTESFKIVTGTTFRGTFPKGQAYVDVDASNRLGVKLMSGSLIANYNTFGNFIINGVTPSSFAQAHQLISDVIGEICCSGGGGSGCIENCTLTDNVNIQTQENVLNFIGETHSFSMNSQELLDETVPFEFNGLKSYNTDSTNVSFLGVIKLDGDSMFTPYQINIAGNPFSVGGGSIYLYNSSAFSDQKNIIYYEDGENKSMYQGFTKDGILITESPLTGGSTLPENTFAIQNQTTGDSITLKSNGNIIHSGAYANTSYVIYTGGDSDTIPDNISEYIYNPATTVSSKQITLPKNPIAGQVLYILAGGTVTSGDVITSFTLNGNGRTIIGEICHKLTVNEMIQLRYIDGGINKWYVLSQCK